MEHETEYDDEITLSHSPLWDVVLLNDDYTTMEFVIEVLESYFDCSLEKALLLMVEIHENGRGVVGTYTRDIAETKASVVMHEAQLAGYPLQAVIRRNT
jgi:ATP-dependent Clp protease adaptor protein ClpS